MALVHPSAIKAFLDRPRDSHAWMKSLSVADVDAAIEALDPRPSIRSPLRLSQKVCFLLGVAYPQFLFQLDMGTGKTLVVLELLRYWMSCGQVSKAFVFAPTEEVVVGWEQEILKWAPELPFVSVLGDSKRKASVLSEWDRGLALWAYPGLVSFAGERVHVKGATRKGKPKMAQKMNRGWLDALCKGVDALVFDESTKATNQSSLTFQACKRLSENIPIRYALAGRSFGREPEQLWGQSYLVDHGAALGTTIGLFREALFKKTKNPFGGPYSFDYKLDPAKQELLSDLLSHRSIRYSSAECVDLPPKINIVKRARLSLDVEEHYAGLIERLKQAKGNLREMRSVFLRLRQLSSGFLGLIDEDDGERVQAEFPVNPKLELLMSLVEEVPPDRKMVIFHEYTYSGRVICERLRRAKMSHGWVWSGTDDYRDLKAKFDTQPDFRVMVVNHKKGAYGLNLQAANYAFFYESPVSCIDRDQAEKRTHRGGQGHTCYEYDLVVEDTVDEAILRFHKEGKDLFAAIVEDPIGALRRI